MLDIFVESSSAVRAVVLLLAFFTAVRAVLFDDTVIGNLFTLNVLAFVGWRLGVFTRFVVCDVAVCFVGC